MYELLCICKPINKKYKFQVDLLNKDTHRTKSIKFGANGMMDYILYNKDKFYKNLF
jgi:hypothetical protein